MTEHKDAMTPGQVSDMIDGALYFVKWGYSENWFVMLWRNGIMWDDSDCGFRPETLAEIGPMVLMPDQISAQAAELTALRAERDRDHAEINLKADFIAATVDQLAQMEADRDAALARVGVLEVALTFYADPETYETQYERMPCDCCTDIFEPINDDKGEKARAALANKGADE